MKKINNRGITTIEIILCFVLVFIMAFSMYGTVSSYNDKRIIEKDKNEILSYKYLLTKTIQDDFVNNELSHVSIENNFDPSGKKTYILRCTLKNGTKKTLQVDQTLGYSTYNPTGLKNQSDSFMISYGTEGDLIEYPLPNLGQTKIEADPSKGISEHTVQELSIQDVKIEVLEHQVLSIQIVFYHPNFGNEYGISIMAPVNYVPDINLPLTSYTLLYDDNGGSGCHDKSIHKMEDDYWGTLCTPTKAKNHFDGWKDGANFVTADTKATKNITVKAEWTPIYKLTYDDNGGSGCSTQKIEKLKNEKWGTLCTPTRAGYEFVGWKNGSNTITKDSTATSDITVKAEWTPIYTLKYNDNGGTGCSTKTIQKKKNEKWGNLCTPTRANYTFKGWKSGSATITKDSKATSDITVSASWQMNKPATPVISNSYNNKWTNTNVQITTTTSSPKEIIGNWYYKYNNNEYKVWSSAKGKKSETYSETANQARTLYVIICNKNASGPTDSANCSGVASTTIKIDKKKPTCSGIMVTQPNNKGIKLKNDALQHVAVYAGAECSDEGGSTCKSNTVYNSKKYDNTITMNGKKIKDYKIKVTMTVQDKAGNSGSCTATLYSIPACNGANIIKRKEKDPNGPYYCTINFKKGGKTKKGKLNTSFCIGWNSETFKNTHGEPKYWAFCEGGDGSGQCKALCNSGQSITKCNTVKNLYLAFQTAYNSSPNQSHWTTTHDGKKVYFERFEKYKNNDYPFSGRMMSQKGGTYNVCDIDLDSTGAQITMRKK